MPVTATVDLAAVRHNVHVLGKQAGTADLMAVVKADAYGHGAVPVAEVLYEEGIRHFAVARPAEGILLRDAGVGGRILVLGATSPEQLAEYSQHDLDATVGSADTAAAVIQHGRSSQPLRVHVKVDTGMSRLGLSPTEVPSVSARLAEAPGVHVAGLWTHFATADDPESPFAHTQLDRFEAVVDALSVNVEHIHVANTGALLTMKERVLDFSSPLVRTGIALYGLGATPELGRQLDVRPVLQLRARVQQLKTVPAGTPISYGAEWRTSRTTRIATLGVGYGDGYPRLCSGRASVRLGGDLCPVVGTICMDMCMVNLGPPDQPPATRVEIGDEAVLFSSSEPTIYDVAQWAETIPYEICSGLSPRVPRRYTDVQNSKGSVPVAHASSSFGPN